MADELIVMYNEETGMWERKPEPFAVVEYPTEEDFEFVKSAVEKQIPKKLVRGYDEDMLCAGCSAFICWAHNTKSELQQHYAENEKQQK